MTQKPAFDHFATLLLNTLKERGARYGTRNVTGPAGVLTRIEDKVARLRQSTKDGQFDPNDWMDLAGYGAIGWLLESGLWDDRSERRRVYFAHPAGEEWSGYRHLFETLHRHLATTFAVFRPVGAFFNVRPLDADWIWAVGMRAIEFADMLVAALPGPSLGVAAEMLYAKTLGKTVWTWTLGNADSSLVRWSSSRIFTDPYLKDIVNAVEEVKKV